MASIRQQPSGSYRVYWRDPAGRQRAKHFRTKREARAFKAQIESELARGSYVDLHAADRLLFRDHAARWLAGRTVEVATAARDESLLRVRVLPRWGDWPLSKIDHLAVQQWVAELGRQLAPATVRECFRVLSLILRSAVQARLLAHNACDGVRLPARHRQDEPVTLTREEVTGKLLPEIPDRYRALVATAAYTGLRWGECVGLHWSAVDLDARRLRVVRVLVEVGGRITPKPYPKSRAGRRTVPVPVPLVELLTAHRAEFPAPDLLFTNTTGGPVGRTSFRTRVWKPAVRRAGLPERLRFHGLRHSYATWLVSEGVPPNIVQRIMGHEDVTTTLAIYTDVPPDYVDRVDSVFDDSLMTDETRDDPRRCSEPRVRGSDLRWWTGRGGGI
jgi:integrase